jgi:hypothetical protein
LESNDFTPPRLKHGFEADAARWPDSSQLIDY